MALVIKEKTALFDATLWRMDERIDTLINDANIPPDQVQMISSWTKVRQQEWLTSRYLLQKCYDIQASEILISPAGKPHLIDNTRYLSISHTTDYVYVAIADIPIGIDLQRRRLDISRIAPKFCSNDELSQLPKHLSLLTKYHLIWSAKESLFKAYGLGEVDFLRHLQFGPFEMEGLNTYTGKCNLCKPNISHQYQVNLTHHGLLFKAVAIQSD